uniref:Ephrin RBD domain-containing protein n=1 Tax=Eptatretus burgeri TaxID=7764 RepID=A0A8C4N439_EPTBU
MMAMKKKTSVETVTGKPQVGLAKEEDGVEDPETKSWSRVKWKKRDNRQFIEKIQLFTPFSLGAEFIPGREYHYISLLKGKSFGQCLRLKMAVSSGNIWTLVLPSFICQARCKSFYPHSFPLPPPPHQRHRSPHIFHPLPLFSISYLSFSGDMMHTVQTLQRLRSRQIEREQLWERQAETKRARERKTELETSKRKDMRMVNDAKEKSASLMTRSHGKHGNRRCSTPCLPRPRYTPRIIGWRQ